jgi:hypothetical protein
MSHEEKINYMRIAAGIAGFSIKNEHLDLLVSIYEKVKEKEGKTNLHDIVDVEYQVEDREKERRVNKLKEGEKDNEKRRENIKEEDNEG